VSKCVLLDVGHGVCGLLVDGNASVMIDCAPDPTVCNYLIAEGITVVHDLVISHMHKDHFGGVPDLLESGIRIERIWLNGDQHNTSDAYLTLKGFLVDARTRGAGIARRHPDADAPTVQFSNFVMTFLGPMPEELMTRIPANRTSVVARIDLAPGARPLALFTGDLDTQGLHKVLESGASLGCEWLVAPHHGGRMSSSDLASREAFAALIAASSPDHVFFPFGRYDGYSLPRPDHVEVLNVNSIPARCGQLSVNCVAESELHQIHRPDFPHRLSAGHDEGPCCAGTVELLSTDDFRWGGRHAHDAHVSTIDRRMCAMPARTDGVVPTT
jgi:beta-lactamase superfamily II metal-dependent hydrolase